MSKTPTSGTYRLMLWAGQYIEARYFDRRRVWLPDINPMLARFEQWQTQIMVDVLGSPQWINVNEADIIS